ncbi:MAG: MotA/TolQ/ExbB proton channel family protein [Planctomycetota bacterium]|nr:MotA/TolQ/ExbB proton channel family protein [Planctomycetota bacterium]
MWGYTFNDLFVRGGFVMYPLLACSIVAVCVAVERIIVFLFRAGSYRQLSDQLGHRLENNSVEDVRSWLQQRRTPLAGVADCYLEHLGRSVQLRGELVGKQASQQITLLERRISWLSVIGHLAPMIGLLGTVWGLVDAFHQIESQGGNVQPSDLASGIWQALLTTVFGLIVALPTLAIYHFLDNRVAAITLQMEWLVAELNCWLDATSSEADPVKPTGGLEGDS